MKWSARIASGWVVVALGCAAPLLHREDGDVGTAHSTVHPANQPAQLGAAADFEEPADAPSAADTAVAEESASTEASRSALTANDGASAARRPNLSDLAPGGFGGISAGLGSVDEILAEGRSRNILDAAAEARIRAELADVPPSWQPHVAAVRLAVLEHQGAVVGRGAAAEGFPPSQRLAEVAAAKPLTPDRPPRPPSGNPLRVPAPQQPPSPAPDDRPSPADGPGEVNVPAVLRPPSTVDAPAADAPPAASGAITPATASGASTTAAAASVGGAPRGPRLPGEAPAAWEEWRVILGAAARSLEEQLRTRAHNAAPEALSDQRKLRLMWLLADRREAALSPVAGAPRDDEQFWNEWVYGASVLLESSPAGGPAQQATVAAHHLREAVTLLGQQGNLEVRHLAFCRRVTSFGVYEKITAPDPGGRRAAARKSDEAPEYVFVPDQEVLIYAEVRNFSSERTEKGYHTQLRASYQIFDAQGRRIGPVHDLGVSHDYCIERRTDFFVRYHRHIPANIQPGRYQLTLTIEDVQSRKVGEGSVEFSIGGGS
jgi:hypothetical protein